MTRVVVVPGVLALLPAYAALADPVADLRAACLAAVARLGADVTVLGDAQGERVAAYLLEATDRSGSEPSFLVVGNGSARRSEKAPGHLDERAHAFDADLRAWLLGDGPLPDAGLGRDLLAAMTGFELMAEQVPPGGPVGVDFDDDPFGVQYWVMRWPA